MDTLKSQRPREEEESAAQETTTTQSKETTTPSEESKSEERYYTHAMGENEVYHAELEPAASILPSDAMLSNKEMLTAIHDPSQPSKAPASPQPAAPSPAQPSAAPLIFSFTEKREHVVSQLVFMCATVLDTLRRACVKYACEKCPACQGVQNSHSSCTLPVMKVWEEARTAVLERVNVLRAVAEWEIWFRGLFNLDAHAVFHLFQVPSRVMCCVVWQDRGICWRCWSRTLIHTWWMCWSRCHHYWKVGICYKSRMGLPDR